MNDMSHLKVCKAYLSDGIQLNAFAILLFLYLELVVGVIEYPVSLTPADVEGLTVPGVDQSVDVVFQLIPDSG